MNPAPPVTSASHAVSAETSRPAQPPASRAPTARTSGAATAGGRGRCCRRGARQEVCRATVTSSWSRGPRIGRQDRVAEPSPSGTPEPRRRWARRSPSWAGRRAPPASAAWRPRRSTTFWCRGASSCRRQRAPRTRTSRWSRSGERASSELAIVARSTFTRRSSGRYVEHVGAQEPIERVRRAPAKRALEVAGPGSRSPRRRRSAVPSGGWSDGIRRVYASSESRRRRARRQLSARRRSLDLGGRPRQRRPAPRSRRPWEAAPGRLRSIDIAASTGSARSRRTSRRRRRRSGRP